MSGETGEKAALINLTLRARYLKLQPQGPFSVYRRIFNFLLAYRRAPKYADGIHHSDTANVSSANEHNAL